MAERITSRTNALMVHIRKLGSSRAHRREAGEYLGDGVKLLDEAVRWGASLTAVVHTADVPLPELGPAVRVAEVPVELMRSISPMETPQGVLFLARQPSQEPPERLSGCRYLALEGVQDPGNVGTILRTAPSAAAISGPGGASPAGRGPAGGHKGRPAGRSGPWGGPGGQRGPGPQRTGPLRLPIHRPHPDGGAVRIPQRGGGRRCAFVGGLPIR